MNSSLPKFFRSFSFSYAATTELTVANKSKFASRHSRRPPVPTHAEHAHNSCALPTLEPDFQYVACTFTLWSPTANFSDNIATGYKSRLYPACYSTKIYGYIYIFTPTYLCFIGNCRVIWSYHPSLSQRDDVIIIPLAWCIVAWQQIFKCSLSCVSVLT